MTISFVIPAYNERETLEPLVDGILEQTDSHQAQIILVDDGSTDGSANIIRRLEDLHPEVESVVFPMNRGKTVALREGFKRVTGDIVFTLDADLQDDPKEIPQFLEKLDDGWDLVCGWKAIRHDPWHKTLPSRLYNGCVARLFNLSIHDVNCGYKVMRKDVAKSLTLYGDRHRLIPVLAAEQGFRVTEIAVEHQPRRYGKSKYGLERFVKGAADVFGLWLVSRYPESPGHFFSTGAIVAVVSGVAALLVAGAIRSNYLLLGVGAGLIAGGIAWFGIGLIAEWLVAQRHRNHDDDA